ncbi:hypothetical protein MIDIC_230076 [Alphaproteobacteria bacterium]
MNDNQNERPELILIDGYGFIFRAYYSQPALTTPSGIPIGGIYGFIRMLFKLLSVTLFNAHATDECKQYIAIILDKGGSKDTFRHQIYSPYKAKRPELPEDLITQFAIMREAIEAFGIKYIDQQGIEADDIIATYAKYGVKEKCKIKIISSDKDLLQLVNDDAVVVYDPIKARIMDSVAVKEKMGITPTQIVDYLALTGDSADNIPGVRGIGAKTAASLLQEYHSLDNIYLNIDKVYPDRIQRLLVEGREMALTSRMLVQLITNAAMPYSIEELGWMGLRGNYQSIGRFLEIYALKNCLNHAW